MLAVTDIGKIDNININVGKNFWKGIEYGGKIGFLSAALAGLWIVTYYDSVNNKSNIYDHRAWALALALLPAEAIVGAVAGAAASFFIDYYKDYKLLGSDKEYRK